ncbi:MAG: hypothetical protein KDE19_03580 [Caldilineaceae bacterium]|nr:hypothetical protein [Caldilineaceae bacterium]
MNEEQIRQLLTEIFVAQSDKSGAAAQELPCHTNQEEIIVYLEAEQSGKNPANEYPALHAQLQSCPTCYTLYAELKELLAMERDGTLVEPPIQARFIVPVLDTVATGHRAVVAKSGEAVAKKVRDGQAVLWTFTELGQLIATLSTELLAAFQPDLQPSYLKAASQELFTIHSPAIAEDLNLTITAQTGRRDHEHCALTVTADIPSRGGWPNLGGITVKLLLDTEELAT